MAACRHQLEHSHATHLDLALGESGSERRAAVSLGPVVREQLGELAFAVNAHPVKPRGHLGMEIRTIAPRESTRTPRQ